MWKREARDSTKEPSQSNQKLEAQRFLPFAPEEPLYNEEARYTDNYSRVMMGGMDWKIGNQQARDPQVIEFCCGCYLFA